MLSTTDHAAFAETEMANGASVINLDRHRPDARSMLREYEAAEELSARSQAIDDQARQLTAAFRSGKAYGETEGYREGFTSGTSWGIFCGAFGTCLLGAIVVFALVMYVGRRVPLF